MVKMARLHLRPPAVSRVVHTDYPNYLNDDWELSQYAHIALYIPGDKMDRDTVYQGHSSQHWKGALTVCVCVCVCVCVLWWGRGLRIVNLKTLAMEQM